MITVVQSCFPCSFAFQLSEERKSQIKEVALKALKDLTASLAYSLAASYFVATGISIAPLFVSALAVTVINIFIRSICPCFRSPQSESHRPDIALWIEQYAPAFVFSIHDFFTKGVLLHEAGHFLSAKLLFNTRAKIVFYPFEKAVTKHVMRQLTGIGTYFGRKISTAIVCSAGAGLSVITSSIQLIAAHCFKQSRPELARYMQMSALMNIFNHAAYVLSACWESLATKPGHDFLLLQKIAGISPIVSLIAVIALPLIVQAGLYALS